MVTFYIWLMFIAGVLGLIGLVGYRISSKNASEEKEQIASEERTGIKDEVISTQEQITKSTEEIQDNISNTGDKVLGKQDEIIGKVEGVSAQLKEEIISEDHFNISITLIQDVYQGRLLSLTDFKHREFPPIQFKNYENSLRDIDWMRYNASLGDFNLKENLQRRFGTEFKVKILEYVFWGWMMEFSQSYPLIEEETGKGVNSSKSGSLLDLEKENIVEIDVPSNGNVLIQRHKRFIFLPKTANFEFNINAYTIETENSILKFRVPSSSEQTIRYKSSDLTKIIYEEFGLDTEKEYNEVNLTFQVIYKRKNKESGNSLADFEYQWYLRLENNMRNDFEFEGVRNKLMELNK